ncbi:MAG: hypothetical protein ACJA2H_000567, partial [Nitriliruptoraceae bacterium]
GAGGSISMPFVEMIGRSVTMMCPRPAVPT